MSRVQRTFVADPTRLHQLFTFDERGQVPTEASAIRPHYQTYLTRVLDSHLNSRHFTGNFFGTTPLLEAILL
jgi:hypothetical protein